MSEDNKFENVDNAIEAITAQIQLLSSRCTLEENKKNTDFDKIIEASSLMLQLARTLNELIATKNFLENSKTNYVDFMNSLMGRR